MSELRSVARLRTVEIRPAATFIGGWSSRIDSISPVCPDVPRANILADIGISAMWLLALLMLPTFGFRLMEVLTRSL